MSVYVNKREIDTITRILREIQDTHCGLTTEHLVEIAVLEAERYGINPEISAPVIRQIVCEI